MPRLLRSSSAFSRWPQRRTFGELLDEFEAVSLAAKPRKRTTLIDYKATIRNHLRPEFGSEDLARLSRRPEAFERYAGEKIAAGLSPKTVRNHLTLLGLIFRQARKWRWVSENPIDLVDKPPADDAETETLTAEEVSLLLDAYARLEEASGSVVVRVGSPDDGGGAFDGPSPG
jgi:site-specific recombinase XerD